ncbi:MAG: class I SAM-dependent methyltransferase, partial [Balneola sp.]
YSMSMFGDYNEFLIRINESLKDGGTIVAVDFDRSPFTMFEKWMKWNHVDISGDLFKQLRLLFKEQTYETKKAYLGLWEYSFFLGSK